MPLEGNLVEKAAQLLRLAHLLNLNPAGYTLKYITDRFECNKGTARSYIAALDSVGFAIEEIAIEDEDEGPLFKLVRMPEKFPAKLKVSCDVILPFYFLLFSAAEEIRGTYLEELAKEASMFFEPFLLDSPYVIASDIYKEIGSMEEFIRRAKRLFVNYANLWHVNLQPVDVQLEQLITAAMMLMECKIVYSSFSLGKTAEWKIRPIHFIRFKDSLVLLALLPEESDDLRTFVVKRIVSVTELDTFFEYPEDVDIKKMLSVTPVSYYTEGTIMRVKLLIDRDIAWIVKDYDWGVNKVIRELGHKGKDGIEIGFDAPYNYELKSSILSLGSKARVLSPWQLQKEIRDELKKAAEKY